MAGPGSAGGHPVLAGCCISVAETARTCTPTQVMVFLSRFCPDLAFITPREKRHQVIAVQDYLRSDPILHTCHWQLHFKAVRASQIPASGDCRLLTRK